jgi:cell division protein FtsB
MWIVIAFFTVIGIFFFTGSHGTFQLVKIEYQKRKLQNQKVSLAKRIQFLEAQKDSLIHQPQAIERIARENYNMVKPGEKVFQIQPE